MATGGLRWLWHILWLGFFMMNSTFRASLVALGAAVILSACNPVPPELRLAMGEPFSPDWCNAAKALPNHGGSLTNVGKCHERGVTGFAKDRNVYVHYYTQGARWGDPDAGASLARLGEPVPDNDLQREAQARSDRDRQMRMLANALRPQPAPRQQPGGFRPMTPTSTFPSAPTTRPSIPSGNFQRSSNQSQSERRVCTNNVCRTERTVCNNGVCNTTVINN